MSHDIVSTNIEQLLEGWIEAERNGVQFPVPFDMAWPMAGYSRKDSAKRYLPKTSADKLFHVSRIETSGRPKDLIHLSIDGLKHLCLMADTEQGATIRDYFIRSEEKWKLVQQVNPQLAQEIELQTLKNEGARLEAQRSQIDLQLVQFRHLVTSTMPEPLQQKILGYNEIKTVEYRDRTITPDGERHEGVGITYVQKRYGFKSTKAAWEWLESVGCGRLSGHWESQLAAVERQSLPIDLLGRLDELAQSGVRQPYLGE
jgi:hypothetical protein